MRPFLLLAAAALFAILALSGCAQTCPVSCDDQNPCTTGYCNSTSGFVCAHEPADGWGCNDSQGVCRNSTCAPMPKPGPALLNYDSRKAESDAYWRAARPFQVLEHARDSSGFTLVVQNVDARQLKVSEISVSGEGFSGVYFAPLYLSGGERKAIGLPGDAIEDCPPGQPYEYVVNFSYDTTSSDYDGRPITGLVQYGARGLIGKCA